MLSPKTLHIEERNDFALELVAQFQIEALIAGAFRRRVMQAA